MNVNAIDSDGMTALIYSVLDNKLELVRYLGQKGACVHYKDRAGWDALHWAIRSNSVDCGISCK